MNSILTYKRLTSVLLLSGLATAFSCQLEETNINPNASADVPISSVLTSAEVSLGFSLGVDGGLITNTFVQQFSGSNGDATSNDNYTSNSGRFNSLWNNLYSVALKDLSLVIAKSKASQQPYYTGIARILSAHGYGVLTDVFGDIPYTQALKGSSLQAPAYDSQESVYQALQLQLDSAISELSLPAASITTVKPGTDDILLQGNAAKWLAAAWTLKARLALHKSKTNPTQAATEALGYLYQDGINYRGIANNAGDVQVTFGASQVNSNPFYQQQANRPGWVGLGAAFVNLLNGNQSTDANTTSAAALTDPRRAYLATPYPTGSTTYKGAVAGVPGAFSTIGTALASATSPVTLISFSEAKFIEAEARLLLSDAKAQESLTTAVNASFSKIITNATDPDATPAKQAAYLQTWATLSGDLPTDLKTIITQKYIALFGQPEVWTDYRRTGFPVLAPAAGGTHALNPNGQIPRRGLYPQVEQQLNPNIPTTTSTYQQPRLWWDQ